MNIPSHLEKVKEVDWTIQELKDFELEGCLEPLVSDFSFSESDPELGASPSKGESGSSSGSD